jgi:hypothetical protein
MQNHTASPANEGLNLDEIHISGRVGGFKPFGRGDEEPLGTQALRRAD